MRKFTFKKKEQDTIKKNPSENVKEHRNLKVWLFGNFQKMIVKENEGEGNLYWKKMTSNKGKNVNSIRKFPFLQHVM